MATGLVNGTDLILKVGTAAANDVIVAYSTSCSLELSMDEIDQTNKDSAGWKSIIGGLRSWSVSCEALYQNEAEASKKAYTDFWNHIGDATLGRTKVYIELSVTGASSGDSNFFYSGDAYVTSLSVNGGTEDQATYSVTMTGSGALAQTAVS
jgi:TP901-1 family phage major tail protein